MSAKPRVLLADDYPGLLKSLIRLLEPSCEIVGTAADGVAALDQMERLQPDVVVIDLGLPGVDGLEVSRRLAATSPGARSVIISAASTEEIADRVLGAPGVSGFVTKHLAAT